MIMAGLRWAFGPPRRPPEKVQAPPPAPPPAVPPAPAPAPAPPPPVKRSFFVFFDWDKADIRPDARVVIEQAVANYRQAKASRIDLTGHADRSGPEGYNVELSLRRANNVKAELVRLGVPEKDIAVVAKGETQPLVSSADGVRE